MTGFVLGALFWHLVGFWSFVSHIVYHGPDDRSAVALARKNDVPAASRNIAADAEKTCIKLMRSPTGGEARSAPCAADDRQHAGSGKILQRQDLLPRDFTKGWTMSAIQPKRSRLAQ